MSIFWNEGFGRSSSSDPPLLIIDICHPRHISSIIRILIPQNSKSIKIKTHPSNSRWVLIFIWLGMRDSFFSVSLRKTPCIKKPNSIGFYLTPSSSGLLRFRIHLLHPYFSKPPSFQKRVFQNIWLARQEDLRTWCRIRILYKILSAESSQIYFESRFFAARSQVFHSPKP